MSKSLFKIKTYSGSEPNPKKMLEESTCFLDQSLIEMSFNIMVILRLLPHTI